MPVTVYVVAEPGDTVTVEVVAAIAGAHVYVVAPLAVNVVELPEHMVGEPADTVMVGVVFTVTTTVFVPVQVTGEVEPVTVYVVVTVGLAVTVAPVVALNAVFGAHVYVPPAPAPLAFNFVLLPEHIVGEVAEALMVGFTVTVIAVSRTKLQPPVPLKLIVHEYVPEQVTSTVWFVEEPEIHGPLHE